MKVMWLSPVVIPQIAKDCGIPVPASGGWVEGLLDSLKKMNNVELCVCFDTSTDQEYQGVIENISYFGFSEKKINQKRFKQYIEFFKPDIIHIFGTEKTFSLSMVLASEELGLIDSTVISIQGLTSVIAKHYYAYLPNRVINGWSFRDLVKHSNLVCEKKLFEKRGHSEIQALRTVKHVIGRTDWDYACVKRINPSIHYHFCNESLRPIFYEKKWSIDSCEKHSIFVSQYSYPLKGFHLILEAMTDVIQQYPDAQLYVTGNNPIKCSLKNKLRQTNYEKYLLKLIRNNRLEEHVSFCGKLDASEMHKRYLRSNVFVCCSSIENSSNSVGEAMILGVPVVASDVGGIKSLLKHRVEGILYQADAPYMLARSICSVFEDTNLATELSCNEIKRAEKTHDIQENNKTLMRIYNSLLVQRNE